MSDQPEKEDVYVLLDFQAKDMSKLLKQQGVYFRMLNLSEPQPIVELGDDVFEGVYEDAVGTNVFFEEVESSQERSIFENETPISLKYFLKQSKVLKLNHIGTKPKFVVNPCPIEPVGIYVNDDYRVLLEKLKKDKLNIDDYLSDARKLSDEDDEDTEGNQSDKEVPVVVEPVKEVKKQEDLPQIQQPQPECLVKEKNSTTDIPTRNKYLKLLKLVEEPRKSENSNYSDIPICDSPTNFYHWKNAMMRIVEQQTINLDINKHNLNDFVNVEDSIRHGVIDGPFAVDRVYTSEEKQKLLSFRNFVNLTPLMKLIVLCDCVNFEKAEIDNMSATELQAEDEHRCTPEKRLKMLSDFKEELRTHILSRIKDGQRKEINLRNTSVDINLSDDEYSCGESSDDSNCSE